MTQVLISLSMWELATVIACMTGSAEVYGSVPDEVAVRAKLLEAYWKVAFPVSNKPSQQLPKIPPSILALPAGPLLQLDS